MALAHGHQRPPPPLPPERQPPFIANPKRDIGLGKHHNVADSQLEVSPNRRAGCKVTACKDEDIKIQKGEIRMGVWVTYEERGSWAWRHWGCVSGQQIENMQRKIGKDKNGEYNWDALDGWEDLE